jgi:hexosaminidase
MAELLTLRSAYDRGASAHGTVTLWLSNNGADAIERFRLALTSTVKLDPGPDGLVRLARQVSGYHELEPSRDLVLGSGEELVIAGLAVGHAPRHANDGPASAFVVLDDGSTRDVHVEPMTTTETRTDSRRDQRRTVRRTDGGPALIPWPATLARDGGRVMSRDGGRVMSRDGGRVRAAARLRSGSAEVGDVWRAVARAERRLYPHGPWALGVGDDIGAGAWPVSVVPGAMAPGYYELTIDDTTDEVVVAASNSAGFRHGFLTLAQLLRDGTPEAVRIVDGPRFEWRGVHVDLARQFFPASDVERLIDLAAWRKLDRLHLHLTDDEAWRVPIEGYPEVTGVGAWRGHELPIPPLLGSPAAASGGSYTVEEIRLWVERARELGVVIVPEVDLPGHCHAALAAVPSLRDPDDATGAQSIQRFVDNSLCPGLPTTMPFVEAVFDTLASLFDSPWLHVGGDEVAPGAWARSPVAAHFARSRGVAGTSAIEAAFMADVVASVRRITGRQVGAWQEVAKHGGLHPADGYVVAWKSAADARVLADAGYDVVISAPDAYYLDMAFDDDWTSPGASWAGTVDLDDVCAFEPGAGWSTEALQHLLGVQACVWTEHIPSAAAFDEMVFPRLDAIAERAWLGRIEGGAGSIAARSPAMPRLSIT